MSEPSNFPLAPVPSLGVGTQQARQPTVEFLTCGNIWLGLGQSDLLYAWRSEKKRASGKVLSVEFQVGERRRTITSGSHRSGGGWKEEGRGDGINGKRCARLETTTSLSPLVTPITPF